RRFQPEAATKFLHDGDRQLVLVRRPGHGEQIRMRAGVHQGAGKAMVARLESVAGAAFAQQGLRQLRGKKTLPDARGADEQIAVRQPAAFPGTLETLHHSVMPVNSLPRHATPQSYLTVEVSRWSRGFSRSFPA